MKITVFGATGRVGTQVASQALAAGHQVTAVVRDPARLAVAGHERLEVVVAPLRDHEALVSAVAGRDAVVSALGARARGSATICEDGARAVVPAMVAAGIPRLLVVSASGMHTGGDGTFTRAIFKPVLGRFLKHAFADMLAMEALVAASDLEWTIVRPPRLTEGAHTGVIASRVGGNVRGSFTISRADVADFLLRVAADGSFVRTAVSIAHG